MCLNRAKAKIEDGNRLCCVCDTKLKGRIDKAFCDYKCKNIYHSENRLRANSAGAITIKKLNRNYHILCYLKGKNTSQFCINRLELIRHGFHFDVITGQEKNRFGSKYQLYEFSYYQIKNQNIMVECDALRTEVSPYVYKRWERHMEIKLQ